jgi:outer membrane biosynthesis protein TonB
LMKIIKFFLLASFFMMLEAAQAQDPEVAFHSGAKAYIGGDVPLAKRIVNDALRYNPTDPKLNELLRKLEEKEKQDQEQQNNQENQEKGENTEEDGEDQQKQDQKPENGELESQDKPSEDPDENQNENSMAEEPQRVEDQRISKEKAMMILEAMRNNEIQYIQQQRKKTQQRPRDNMPDW